MRRVIYNQARTEKEGTEHKYGERSYPTTDNCPKSSSEQ
jgi:hypothetical protein